MDSAWTARSLHRVHAEQVGECNVLRQVDRWDRWYRWTGRQMGQMG